LQNDNHQIIISLNINQADEVQQIMPLTMNVNFQSAQRKRKFIPIIEKMLGEILVEGNIISPRHLQIALDRQKKQTGKYKYIGEILIEMGIPREKINEALDVYDKRKPIGQVCLDLKIITPDQLQKALEKQSQLAKMAIRRPLGKLLVEMGFTTTDEYMDALSKHFNIPIVSLRGFFPSPSLQRAVGEKYAQKQRIVVLEDYSAKIKLALPEPNPLVMDELRRVFSSGKKVEFCLASPIEIDYCMRNEFDPFSVSHYR
jgi:Type II secretion system (T2SS), protein E, N-terminal domain